MTTRGHPNPRKLRPGRCREPRPLRPSPGDAVPGSAPAAPTPGRAGRAPFCLQGNSPRTVRTSRQVFRTGGRGGRGRGRAGSRKVRKRNAAAAVPGCRPAASRSRVLEAPPWPPGAERQKDTFGLDLAWSAESDALWPPNGSLGTAGRRPGGEEHGAGGDQRGSWSWAAAGARGRSQGGKVTGRSHPGEGFPASPSARARGRDGEGAGHAVPS